MKVRIYWKPKLVGTGIGPSISEYMRYKSREEIGRDDLKGEHSIFPFTQCSQILVLLGRLSPSTGYNGGVFKTCVPYVSAQTSKIRRRMVYNTNHPEIVALGDRFDMKVLVFEFHDHCIIHKTDVVTGVDNLFDR
jgi:hypothetical protein